MRRNAYKEAEGWAKTLSEVDRKCSAYQIQQAEKLTTLDELRSKVASMEEMRTVALTELEPLRSRQEQMGQLENDADVLSEHTLQEQSRRP